MLGRTLTLALAIGVSLAWFSASGAQPTGKTVPRAPVRDSPARTPNGTPDLNGVWQVMNTANWDIEDHDGRPALLTRPGPAGPVPAKEVLQLGAIGAVPQGLGVVEGGAIPYKPEALAQRAENREKWLENDPERKCYLPGVPRANYMQFPFEIVQSRSQILFSYQYAGAVRNVFLKDPGPAQIDSWMGQSVGKWEGNSLVITVTGQNDQSWFDRSGNHHSSDMVVVERFTPTGPGLMRYEATITDPQTFTRPWKISMTLYRRVGQDARMMQFNCVPYVEEMLYGTLRKNPLK